MGKISFSNSEKSIQSIWNWYEDQKKALNNYRFSILDEISLNKGKITDKFIDFTISEVNEYFDDSEQELENLVCFDLISATEAALRVDFFKKVYNKSKSNLSRDFRAIHKAKGNKISLETDIIDLWKDYSSQKNKREFSQFLGLLNFRHWLAHGRYWTPRFGEKYDAMGTYNIAEKIFLIIN